MSGTKCACIQASQLAEIWIPGQNRLIPSRSAFNAFGQGWIGESEAMLLQISVNLSSLTSTALERAASVPKREQVKET